MPIANGFLTEQDFENEYYFDMDVAFCESCKMVQLVNQPDREQMFNKNYAFFSSTSKFMQKHFKSFYEFLNTNYLKSDDPFVVEMGSNDGIMLKNFKENSIRHLGIEPSDNVAKIAQDQGINTWIEFFDEKVADKIIEKYGQADVFYSANVMCHIPYLHSIAAGIKKLLKPSGVLAFEDPYLGDIIQKTSYDQIYDEHVFFFSVNSVNNVFNPHGLEVIDVQSQHTHGGSMRYILGHTGHYPINDNVNKQLAFEEKLQLNEKKTYNKFKQNVENSKDDLIKLLKQLKQANKKIIGYAATSKSTTILNYCGITPDLIDFITDTTPIKMGKYSPGVHIPVVSYLDHFKKPFPDYVFLFAWNHMEEIMQKEADFNNKNGKWITHVPNVKIM